MPTTEEILAAAETVVRERGLSGATTKEIARVAGCSEGSIYNHFPSKHDLLARVISQTLGDFPAYVRRMDQAVGTATVEENLLTFARMAVPFLRRIAPMIGTMLVQGEDDRIRTAVPRERGPRVVVDHLVAYLEGEAAAGRVRADVDAVGTAMALLGACQMQAHVAITHGSDQLPYSDEDFTTHLITGLMRGLGEIR